MDKGSFSKILITNCIVLAATQSFAQVNSIHESWAGAYFGAYFGSGQGNAGTSFSTNSNANEIEENVGSTTQVITTTQSSGQLSGNMTGSMSNLFVGYNFQSATYTRFVFGGQLEGTFFSNITASTNGQKNLSQIIHSDDGIVSSTSITNRNTSYSLNYDLTSFFTVLARGGYLVNSNLLLYALAGGVEGNFSFTDNDDFSNGDKSTWVLGYTIGAGIEYKINDNWSLRGEYRYMKFTDITRNSKTSSLVIIDPDGPSNATTTNSTANGHLNGNINFNIGMVGIVYQFN